MATYEFKSLDELADFMTDKCTDAEELSVYAKLVRDRTRAEHEAATWRAAARLVRSSKIVVDSAALEKKLNQALMTDEHIDNVLWAYRLQGPVAGCRALLQEFAALTARPAEED